MGANEIVLVLMERVHPSQPPVTLSTITAEILSDKVADADRLDIVERAEKLAAKVKAKIASLVNQTRENGSFLPFELNEANDDYIQGSCFVSPADDDSIKDAKQKRALTLQYKNSFDKLTPTDFENLCGKVLSLLSVEEPQVSRASADQGIDFYGQLSVGRLIKTNVLTPGAEEQIKLWLVGQAKHYRATQVSTADIRELVGSVELASSIVFAGQTDPLSQLKIRRCDPVVFLFFTTGRLSRDAKNLLNRSGVVGMDGDQLAMFLADHGVGANGVLFSEENFADWLASK